MTERGFLIAMGYTGRKGNSKKLLEKASILEAVGSVGSSSMWNMGIRLCDCIPGKITAWSWLCRRPGARGGEPRERWPRDDLCEASPCVIFLILWHETENFSISLGICLG